MNNNFEIKRISLEHDPINIYNNEDFKKLDISGNGTKTNPYVIEELKIIDTTVNCLIEIVNTTAYFVIRNNVLNGLNSTYVSVSGICCRNVTNGIITNNLIGNVTSGICIGWFSKNNIVSNNTISGTTLSGIYVSDSSDSNTVIGNTIRNSEHEGILLKNSASNNTIAKNNVSKSCYGIYISIYCDYNRIEENLIFNNTGRGIHIQSSDFNEVKNNSLYFNVNLGIYFGYSSENTIRWNDFIYNSDNGKSQAETEAHYYNIFTFNYWNEWISPDNNSDGIVDFPYNITDECRDMYPLVLPNNPIYFLYPPIETTSRQTIDTTQTKDTVGLSSLSIIVIYLIFMFYKRKKFTSRER